MSKEIKNTNIKVRTSGEIDNVNLAEKLIRNKCIDFVAVGKMFIKNPNWIKNETKKRKIKIIYLVNIKDVFKRLLYYIMRKILEKITTLISIIFNNKILRKPDFSEKKSFLIGKLLADRNEKKIKINSLKRC